MRSEIQSPELKIMRFKAILSLAAATVIASFASANAQQGVKVGVLECRGGQKVGMVVGSVTQLQCVFRGNDGRVERYMADVKRIGLDLGITQGSRLAWLVHAPTARVGHGALAGRYTGVGANATVGVGVGANLLVGGSQNTFSLQPLSVQGQTGLAAQAGVVDVELRSVAGGHRGHRHHHRHH